MFNKRAMYRLSRKFWPINLRLELIQYTDNSRSIVR